MSALFANNPPCKALVGRRGGGVVNQPLISRCTYWYLFLFLDLIFVFGFYKWQSLFL